MSTIVFSQKKVRQGSSNCTLSKDTLVIVFNDKDNFAGNTVWILQFYWTTLNTTSAYIEPVFGLSALDPMRVMAKSGTWYDTLQLNPGSGSRTLYASVLPTGAIIFKIHHGTNATGTLRWDWFAIKQ
jgi:hypothetical protein